MKRVSLTSEGLYVNALIHGRPEWLRRKLERQHREIVQAFQARLQQLTCPFCGRRFAKLGPLVRHLQMGPCKAAFHGLVLALARGREPREEVVLRV